jgi:DtxR family Mn-dependent transcriptional regulator
MARIVCHAPRLSLLDLTPSEEEYLEAIFMEEQKTRERVKVKELAGNLSIKAPSVVGMLRKLKKLGLVEYDRSGVKLTKRGRKQAIRIVRRHQLAERLLSDVFGYGLPKVHDLACRFEHVLDDELADRLDKMLGKPRTCPHGEPIPSSDGRTIEIEGERLSDVGGEEECVVMVIPEDRGAVNRLLSLNVLPGAKIKIVEKLPRGAIILQCGRTQVALSRNIASKILVGMYRHRRRRRGRG